MAATPILRWTAARFLRQGIFTLWGFCRRDSLLKSRPPLFRRTTRSRLSKNPVVWHDATTRRVAGRRADQAQPEPRTRLHHRLDALQGTPSRRVFLQLHQALPPHRATGRENPRSLQSLRLHRLCNGLAGLNEDALQASAVEPPPRAGTGRRHRLCDWAPTLKDRAPFVDQLKTFCAVVTLASV